MIGEVDPREGREAARAIIAGALAAREVTYVPHPGELDWWLFHDDPRHEPVELYVDPPDAVAVLDRTNREGFLVGRSGELLGDLVAWLEDTLDSGLGPGPVTVGWISDHDVDAQVLLASRGFRPDGGMPVFERPLEALGPPTALPDGVTIRPLAGPDEADARADAARLAFESTMEPSVHRERYRRFMASPAYEPARDVVAVDALAGGRVSSFAIWWPDPVSRIAQFEPVGTRPDAQGRGLARAVLERCLADMRAAGMDRARVCTDDHRDAAIGLYAALGFTVVDHVTWWTRP